MIDNDVPSGSEVGIMGDATEASKTRMRAAVLNRFGGPEEVELSYADIPTPGEGEVRVRVKAASLNFTDLLVMNNGYQLSAEPPFTPGAEFAGVVEETGPGVAQFAVGDRIAGSAFVGAFAEQVCAPVGRCRTMPAELDWVHAAAYGASTTTAYHALVTVGQLRPDEVVVVLGAAGGVGSASVGMASRLGARVIAVVSSDEKSRFAREQGAHEVVNYRTEDLRESLRGIAPDGVSLVIDPVGGDCTGPALRSLRRGGTFVVVGFASGEVPQVPLNLVLIKGIRILAVDVRTLREHRPDIITAGNVAIGELIHQGWRPPIDSTYPLAQIREALDRVAGGRALGKVVLTVD
jgi:NADPH2:quinone reductase